MQETCSAHLRPPQTGTATSLPLTLEPCLPNHCRQRAGFCALRGGLNKGCYPTALFGTIGVAVGRLGSVMGPFSWA